MFIHFHKFIVTNEGVDINEIGTYRGTYLKNLRQYLSVDYFLKSEVFKNKIWVKKIEQQK